MKTETQVRKELVITSESYIVRWVDIKEQSRISSLVADNNEDAIDSCKRAYGNQLKYIIGVGKGTIDWPYEVKQSLKKVNHKL